MIPGSICMAAPYVQVRTQNDVCLRCPQTNPTPDLPLPLPLTLTNPLGGSRAAGCRLEVGRGSPDIHTYIAVDFHVQF